MKQSYVAKLGKPKYFNVLSLLNTAMRDKIQRKAKAWKLVVATKNSQQRKSCNSICELWMNLTGGRFVKTEQHNYDLKRLYDEDKKAFDSIIFLLYQIDRKLFNHHYYKEQLPESQSY